MFIAPSRRLVGLAVAIPIFVAFALAMFAWPNANLAPRDLPVGLVGPAQATAQIGARLQAATSSGFDLRQFGDEAAATQAIRHRDVYAAIVVGRSGVTLLVATAAGPVVAQLLTAAMSGHGSQRPPTVVDVVPAPANDPRGAALGSSILPLVITGAITGALVALLSFAGIWQAAMLVVVCVLSGLVATGGAQGWLGVLQGSWEANAGALTLMLLAIAATVVGLKDLIGPAGMAAGMLLMIFVGNPLSGITSAPELLPKAAGLVGQLLPPGAGGSLLRCTAFFDGNGGSGHVVVLLAWVLCGYAAIGVAAMRRGGVQAVR